MANWGILGASNIAYEQFLPAINKVEKANLKAVASRSSKKVSRFGIEHVYESYEALLQDPSIGVVYIPLPNALHAQYVQLAIEHGKHVLVEKPATISLNEMQEIALKVDESNLVVLEAFMYQYHIQHQKMKELLPQVGEIREIKAHFSWLLEDEDDIRLNEQLGGGALYDVGCYCMHVITQMVGYKPQRILMTSPQDDGVDETSHVVMYDENNTLASFTCSMRMPFENYYTIYGNKGILRVEHSFRPDVSPDRKGIVTLLDQNERILEQHHLYDESYVKQIEYMEKCIAQEASSNEMLQSSLEMAKYIELAYRSRKLGEWVKVEG
nr:Gfo/Idh/MocA family oxidoreductase [Lysinibacillus timonensis]